MESMNMITSPLLSVKNLKTHFFMDEGVVKAVDGVTFDVYAGQVFGIVGESGCGKSVTMKAVLRIVEPPGKVVGGQIMLQRKSAQRNGSSNGDYIDLATLDANGKAMRDIRGAEIALIPQEPMASFSPVHTIGDQIVEAIMLHQSVDKREARKIAVQLLKERDDLFVDPVLGAVGWLQVEVVQHRLKSEYGVEAKLERLPYTQARWVFSKDGSPVDILALTRAASIECFLDVEGRPLFLFENDWMRRRFEDKHPDLVFVAAVQPGRAKA